MGSTSTCLFNLEIHLLIAGSFIFVDLGSISNITLFLSIVKAVVKSNQDRKLLLTKRIINILGNKLKNKKITFLGVTFKPNTDDIRESIAIKLIKILT